MADKDDLGNAVVIGAGIALGLVALIKIMEAMSEEEDEDEEE